MTETQYSNLIAQLVNDARREIEDSWNWLELRTTIQIDTVVGYSQYTLADVGNSRFKILEVINDTDDYYLRNMPSQELTRRFLFGEAASGKPQYYGFNGFDTDGNPIVDVYPIPDTVMGLHFNVILPQNDLTSDNEVLKVPGHLIVLGAYMKALAERGEDASNGYVVARAVYQDSLASNISQQESMMPNETDWVAV